MENPEIQAALSKKHRAKTNLKYINICELLLRNHPKMYSNIYYNFKLSLQNHLTISFID
jgi:hypothetical protein